MNVKRIEKVTNGWVVFNEYDEVMAVATNGEQLAEILDINTKPATYHTDSVYLTQNPDFNSSEFWMSVKDNRKIDAIKAFRRAFVSEDHGKVTVALKYSMDFVESIFQNMANNRNGGWL